MELFFDVDEGEGVGVGDARDEVLAAKRLPSTRTKMNRFIELSFRANDRTPITPTRYRF